MKINVQTFFFFFALIVCISAQSVIHPEMLEKIFKQHCAQLKNTDIKHNRFIITFSGTPGMGKSFIARYLEEKYKAVRISTDELRKLAESLYQIPLEEYQEFLAQYSLYFLNHYKSPNQRIILDASIDRKYKQLFPYFEQHKICFSVIRLEVPKELIIKRLNEREKSKAAWYLKNLDGWLTDYEDFAKNYHNYISLANIDSSALDKLTLEF